MNNLLQDGIYGVDSEGCLFWVYKKRLVYYKPFKIIPFTQLNMDTLSYGNIKIVKLVDNCYDFKCLERFLKNRCNIIYEVN